MHDARCPLRSASYWAAALIVASAILRLILVALGWPHLNADEATIGLMARHIALDGDHPVYFYGQAYMGALEAYLAAPWEHVIGNSPATIRIGMVFLFVLFMTAMYRLAQKIYGPRVALITIAFFALGSEDMLLRQLQALGGYAESLVLGTILMLISVLLAVESAPTNSGMKQILGFGGWGLAAGLAVWSDLLVAPYVLASACLILLFRRSDLFGVRGVALASAFLVGVAPVLAFDVGHGQNPISTFLSSYHSQAGIPNWLGVVAGLVVSLPAMTGGSALGQLSAETSWPVATTDPYVMIRTLFHAVWGLGVAILWIYASAAGIARLRSERAGTSSQGSKHQKVRSAANLALLSAAGITFALYVLSAAAYQSPALNARYLTCIWISVPAILAPLIPEAGSDQTHRISWTSLGLVAVILAAGVAETFSAIPANKSLTDWQSGFVSGLEARGIKHIYTDYWTCDRVAFQSGESVTCAVLTDSLRPGLNRVPEYRDAVTHDPRSAFAFPYGSAGAAAIVHRWESRSSPHRRWLINSYVVVQPLPRGSHQTTSSKRSRGRRK